LAIGFRSDCVDAADHLSDGGHISADEGHRFLLQGSHPLLLGQAAELILGRPPDEQALELGGDPEELEDPDAVPVARARAEVATLSMVEDLLGRAATLLVERQLLGGRLVGRLARRADAPDQALADDPDDR
jgi:hypothetical protein